VLAVGDNTGDADDFLLSCTFGGDGEDVTYEFTAPTAGTWRFSTVGSTIDTVLGVLDTCGGTELACDDDGGGSLTSITTADLTAGQTVVVVVDGYDEFESGDYQLLAELVPVEDCTNTTDDDSDGDVDCADADCATDPACLPTCPDATLTAPSAAGDNTGADATFDPSCAAPSADHALEFTAPADGTYQFDLTFDDVLDDAVLSAWDGCSGPELDCADNGFDGDTETITLTLTSGQTVVLVVAGYQGDVGGYTLTVQ
jgi:hypothetical protein